MDLVAPDFWRGIILTTLFVAIALWENAQPEWRATAPTGRRWSSNLTLYVLCTVIAIAVAPLRAIAFDIVPSVRLLPVLQNGSAVAVHFAAALLILDLAYYLGHRLLHGWTPLWRLHAVHHTDLDLDITTTLRHHPAEVLFFTAVVAAIGALIGITPGEALAYGMVAFGVQLLAHANVALPGQLTSILGALIVTPAFHRLHHSRDQRECHANFGEVFSFWDRLFGTAATAEGHSAIAFGVDHYLAPRHQRLGWMLLQPFVPGSSRSP